MRLMTVVLGCFLLGEVPTAAPLPGGGDAGAPAILQPVGRPDARPTTSGASGETDPTAVGADGPAKADAEEPVKTEPEAAAVETPPVPVPPVRHQLTPPEMVAEALMLPPGSRLTGRPLTLLTALSSSTDRRRQLEVIRAYWRLVEAVAVYRFGLDHDRRLQAYEAQAEEPLLLRTARASSAAVLGEAEVAAVAAQHELAALVLLPADAPLPLPSDRPHVGPYRTYFNELFSMRTPPARAKLIDRTLSIRRRAIDGRALAVQAADDALSAMVDAHRRGRADLSAVLACMGECLRGRQALIESVCRYNHDIADYALAVVGPETTGEALVRMLIKPARDPARPLALGNDDRGVQRAGHTERVPTPAKRPEKNAPALSPPRHPPEGRDQQAPTPATRWSPSKPSPKNGSAPAPPREEPRSSGSAVSDRPVVPVEPEPAEPIPTTVNKPVLDARDPLAAPTLYPALVDATPGTRARQLTLSLHWDRTLPDGSGEPASLEDCLRGRSGGERRALIEAYWLVRQRAAEYQVLAQHADWLEDVVLLGPQDENHPASPRLRSARLTTEAALHEAHVVLVEAQFELATRMGRVSDTVWPMPSTVPHSGEYLLKLDAQPRRLVESWRLRRLAATIPGLTESLHQRATAVIEADIARAAATTSYQIGSQSIETVLACISRQTKQTFAFLQTLTDYNRAIAEYTLMVLPPDTPSEKLAEALVVEH